MSARDRRSFKASGVFGDISKENRHRRESTNMVREHDKSTPWIYMDGGFGWPSYGNSWFNYGSGWGPGRFMRDSAGIVHTQGFVGNNFNASTGYIFVYPEGYRPNQTLMFMLTGYFNDGTGLGYHSMEAMVQSNGIVILSWAGGNPILWITLTPLIFPADQ